MPDDAKTTSARAFVRSFNILLKFARLYSFDHVRTNEQFTTAWDELHAAVPADSQTGLLLGASGTQLLLDGAPLDATPAERSFAQLLSSAGLASIQFAPCITKEELAKFVRAFPTTGNAKPGNLAAQLKTAIAGSPGIRVNEVRFVAEDESMSEVRTAAQLTAKALGGNVGQLKDLLNDPQKLLQLIAAAEGSRGGTGNFGSGFGTGEGGTGAGSGSGPAGGTENQGSAPGVAAGNSVGGGSEAIATQGPGSAAAGVGAAGWAVQEEEVLNIFRVLGHMGRSAANPSEPGIKLQLSEGVKQLSAPSRDVLRQALQSLASKSQGASPSKPALLRVAEHLAIRFALERYERGEVRVNAVREMLDKMNQEIEALRSILGSHEEKMAEAGLFVEGHTELLDRQFWAAVPENGKRTVLTSPEAWCIPPRNVKLYVDELRRRGDHKLAAEILADLRLLHTERRSGSAPPNRHRLDRTGRTLRRRKRRRLDRGRPRERHAAESRARCRGAGAGGRGVCAHGTRSGHAAQLRESAAGARFARQRGKSAAFRLAGIAAAHRDRKTASGDHRRLHSQPPGTDERGGRAEADAAQHVSRA